MLQRHLFIYIVMSYAVIWSIMVIPRVFFAFTTPFHFSSYNWKSNLPSLNKFYQSPKKNDRQNGYTLDLTFFLISIWVIPKWLMVWCFVQFTSLFIVYSNISRLHFVLSKKHYTSKIIVRHTQINNHIEWHITYYLGSNNYVNH